MEKKTVADQSSNYILKQLSRRFLVIITLAYIAGIMGGRFYIQGTSGLYWLIGLFIFLLATGLYYRRLTPYSSTLIYLAAAAGAITYVYAFQPPADTILNYAGASVYVEGTIVEEPLYFGDHTAYRLKVEKLETGQGPVAARGIILLKVYGEEVDNYWFGEKIRLRGSIISPRGKRNPGGFDYRYYLRSQGIDAVIHANPSQVTSIGTGKTGFLAASALQLRSRMVESIMSNLPPPSAELLTAILFGQRHRLPEEIEENFRRAGAGHLMAVSGLHVGLLAALILGACRRFRLHGFLPLIAAITLVFIYAYLTGMRPSALRAAIMISAALGALLMEREQDLPITVSLAAMITLFINPLLLFTVGFQLSYAATLSIIYAYRPLTSLLIYVGCPKLLIAPFAVTAAAQIGVLPLSLYYFHHLPVGALLFNLLLLPLISLVVGLGLSGAAVSLVFTLPGAILLWASRPLLEIMIFITSLSSYPGFYLPVNPPGNTLLFILYGSMAVALFLYYRWEERPEEQRKISFIKYLLIEASTLLSAKSLQLKVTVVIFLTISVIVVWTGLLFPKQNLLTVTFIDVGQGAAALIEAPCGAVIMVDAGGSPAYRGDPGETGKRVILPFLRQKMINKIDLAIITHPHEDHFGGFIPLLDEVTVKTMLISPVESESIYYHQLLRDAKSKGSQIIESTEGDFWLCEDGLFLEIIGPPDKLFRGSSNDLNNNSIVFILRYGEVVILFTGDIEDDAAREILRRRVDLTADLLLVPHHGGYLEAMPLLLEAVEPTAAIIQVGPNSFGHPHSFVTNILEQRGISVYRNDLHGAIIVETDGFVMKITVTEEPLVVGY